MKYLIKGLSTNASSIVWFIFVGGLGFVVDLVVTSVFIVLGSSPYWARVPAILLSISLTWLLNRTYTFSVKGKASKAEAVRYAMVAITMAVYNYSVYSLFVLFGMNPYISLVAATLTQVALSYYGYRKYAFRVCE